MNSPKMPRGFHLVQGPDGLCRWETADDRSLLFATAADCQRDAWLQWESEKNRGSTPRKLRALRDRFFGWRKS